MKGNHLKVEIAQLSLSDLERGACYAREWLASRLTSHVTRLLIGILIHTALTSGRVFSSRQQS